MINFEENAYMARELFEDKRLSINAKYLFTILDEKCYISGENTIAMSNKEALEELAIKSPSTLSKVKDELKKYGFVDIEVKSNKVYYTPKFSYLRGDR